MRWDRLRTDEAERVVRERVANTDNVIISEHAYDRKDERFAFTSLDIFYILESGHAEGVPVRENEREWKVILVRRMPGTREAGVVTLIAMDADTLFVKTVQWMDWLR